MQALQASDQRAAPQLLRHGKGLHEPVHYLMLALGECVHARHMDCTQASVLRRCLLVELKVQRGPQRQALAHSRSIAGLLVLSVVRLLRAART